MQQFELKIANGKRVVWKGENPKAASTEYARTHGETVVAWRHYPRHGIFELSGDPRELATRIIEPGHPLFGKESIAYCDVCGYEIFENQFHTQRIVDGGDGGEADFYTCSGCLDATAVSGYTYNPDRRWPESDDRPCIVCGHAEDGPHSYPCVDDHDLELIAAEMAEREADCYLAGYDATEAMVTTERWVAGQ